MKRFAGVLLALAPIVACRHVVRTEACPQPFRLSPSGQVASLPATPAPPPTGLATLTGFVSDSSSGTGLDGALVQLTGIGVPDSVRMAADSEGRFTVGELHPGRYRLLVGSVNFQWRRDTIEVRPGIDTLRVTLRRGPPLCSVRMTD